MSRPRALVKAALPAAALALLAAAGLRNGALVLDADPFAVYQDAARPRVPAALRFIDESRLLGSWPPMSPMSQYKAFVAVDDYDADGRPDVLLLSYPTWTAPVLRLLRNAGGGRFVDATAAAGLSALSGPGRRPSALHFCDLDNDGYPELLVGASPGALLVLRNERGRFRDATREFGVAGLALNAVAVNSADLDGDGDLDVVIGNYFPAGAPPSHPRYSGDVVLSRRGGPNALLRNDGGRRLVNVAREAGVEDFGHTWSTLFADFDRDGRPDLFLANDFGLVSLYRNLGGMRFSPVTRALLGPLRSSYAMGSDAGDADGDGLLDFYVSDSSKPGQPRGFGALWLAAGPPGAPRFRDKAAALGVDRCGFAWGSKWADLDRDGRLDLVVVNGLNGRGPASRHDLGWENFAARLPRALKGLPLFSVAYDPRRHSAPGQRNCVFLNEGDRFVDVAREVGMRDEANGRGLAVADYDDDGAPDLIVANVGSPPLLYRNEPAARGASSWLGLRLVGSRSNRSAVGALVRARTARRLMSRLVAPGNGFSAQSDRRVLFGWPAGERLESVEILWPSGRRQALGTWRLGAYQDVIER